MCDRGLVVRTQGRSTQCLNDPEAGCEVRSKAGDEDTYVG